LFLGLVLVGRATTFRKRPLEALEVRNRVYQ